MTNKYLKFTAYLIILIFAPIISNAGLINVGPTRAYKTPSQAARIAKDGTILRSIRGPKWMMSLSGGRIIFLYTG